MERQRERPSKKESKQVTSESVGIFVGLIYSWLFSYESVLKPRLGQKQLNMFRNVWWFGRTNQYGLSEIFLNRENIFPLLELHYPELPFFFFFKRARLWKRKKRALFKDPVISQKSQLLFHSHKSGIIGWNGEKSFSIVLNGYKAPSIIALLLFSLCDLSGFGGNKICSWIL